MVSEDMLDQLYARLNDLEFDLSELDWARSRVEEEIEIIREAIAAQEEEDD